MIGGVGGAGFAGMVATVALGEFVMAGLVGNLLPATAGFFFEPTPNQIPAPATRRMAIVMTMPKGKCFLGAGLASIFVPEISGPVFVSGMETCAGVGMGAGAGSGVGGFSVVNFSAVMFLFGGVGGVSP